MYTGDSENLYLKIIDNLKKENEMYYNTFVAYQNMISKILVLPFYYNEKIEDGLVSMIEIQKIIKNEQEALKEKNKLIADNLNKN